MDTTSGAALGPGATSPHHFLGSLTIGAQPVEVSVVPDLPTLGVSTTRGGHALIGLRSFSGPADAATLLHELVHTALDACLGPEFFTERAQEAVARAVEVGVSQALRSSPDLAKAWLALLLSPAPAPLAEFPAQTKD